MCKKGDRREQERADEASDVRWPGMNPTTRAFVPRNRAVEESTTHNREALAEDPIRGKENDEEVARAQTTNHRAVATVAREILGMALEAAMTPASVMENPNSNVEETQQPADGGELET